MLEPWDKVTVHVGNLKFKGTVMKRTRDTSAPKGKQVRYLILSGKGLDTYFRSELKRRRK